MQQPDPAADQALPPPPAEWAPHAAIWTAWPADAEIWPGAFEEARAQVAAMVRLLAEPGPDGRPGDRVRVLAHGEEAVASATALVGDVAEIVPAAYGDIWLRDIGPIFRSEDACTVFAFNGWGEKYVYPHDDTAAARIAGLAGARIRGWDFVLEGGGLDWDGEGTVLTTRECLLNPNRNPGHTQEDVERMLSEALGIGKVIWIDRGLLNDHTDGHVDNIARFVAPGLAVVQSPSGDDDPHAERLAEIAAAVREARDARGRRLQVKEIPSPGRVLGLDGEVVPASHMNFIIGNASVVVPTYGDTPQTAAAIEALQALFPDRRVVGSPASYILSGGGAFHCITQQQPAGR
ncbi:MAG: agmatine deiminase family protein [Hyphomonadaceae bacterium]